MLFSPEHWQNTEWPRPVTLSGIVMDSILVHSINAPFPMYVTLLGIVTEVRFEQARKAFSPIFVTVLGITISRIPGQPRNSSWETHVVPGAKVTSRRFVQPQKIPPASLLP